MNFRQLSSNELAYFAANIQEVLASGEIASMRPDVRADLLAALGTLPTELAALAEEVVAFEAARMAKVSERNTVRARARAAVARVRNTLRAARATKMEYALCGFTKPKRRRKYIANDPTDATATGTSNGVNRLKFTGNNRAAQVIYEIWRRESRDGVWVFQNGIKRQTYIDTNVVPGRYYEYKVRAVGTRTISDFSNSAVVS